MNTNSSKAIRVRTQVKAGALSPNHNASQASGLRLKTQVKAGALSPNHNQNTVR